MLWSIQCMFAHSKEEELYHPSMYKTVSFFPQCVASHQQCAFLLQRLCNSYPSCTRYYCPFAHSEEELRKPKSKSAASIPRPPDACLFAKPLFPASPASSPTTASSAVTSPLLSTSSPTSGSTKANNSDSQFDIDRHITGTSHRNCSLFAGLGTSESVGDSAWDWGRQKPGENNKNCCPSLSTDEAKLYSDILMRMLQRKGESNNQEYGRSNFACLIFCRLD